MNPYDKLGVSPNASLEDVKKAYRELAQKYHTDASTESPIKEEYEAEMAQINDAFDEIIANIKTGGTSVNTDVYEEIRSLINSGNADLALSRLNELGTLSGDAEWNFLMGSAYYYKGWVNQAVTYIEAACRLAPANREYSATLQNLKGSVNGNMNGSPFANDASSMGAGPSACGPCDMCSVCLCSNLCCNCGRGGCC
ncbi:MAG: DnaJ domain-containing protein [Oscillospiraceae bacterium]